jgi:hypothetical protein
MSRRWLAAGAAAVVAAAALAALGGWYLLLRDDVEPATVADAVAAFRAQDAAVAGAASLIGDVRVEEDVSLRLTSLTPRR